MSGPAEAAPSPDADVRNYTFLGLTALLLLLLALLVRGFGTWSLLPVVVGLAGLRWRNWGLFMLASLVGLLFVSFVGQSFRPNFQQTATPVSDLLLAAAVLAYMAAHYRLISLTRFAFPRDPRSLGQPAPRGRRPTLEVPARRSPETATPGELFLLLASLPLVCGLALVCQQWLVPAETTPDDLRVDMNSYEQVEQFFLSGGQALVDALWRSRPLLWWLGGGVVLISALLNYLGWRRMTATEAALALQDTVWTETRGEQRRINSWLVWARLRRRRREDAS
jgi:hypothetical protein